MFLEELLCLKQPVFSKLYKVRYFLIFQVKYACNGTLIAIPVSWVIYSLIYLLHVLQIFTSCILSDKESIKVAMLKVRKLWEQTCSNMFARFLLLVSTLDTFWQ